MRMDREIKILKSTYHHNIIKIYSVIETPSTIYLVMEYAEGGELFNYIILKRRLGEFEACKYFHQIIDAVDYIHKMGICHRDLKPENMLIDFHRDLKLIDFGLSNLYKRGELLKTACGSPGYAAPEMIKGDPYNGMMTDIWSCGIILFVLICGFLPFDDPSENVLYDKIVCGKFAIPSFVSPQVKDLIRKILVTDPQKRFTINDIRNHPWYNMYNVPKVEGLFISVQSIPIDNFIIDSMKSYGYDPAEVKRLLLENRHNNITTLYYLIIKKNMRKGITSVSDLISKQFISYINKISQKKPPQYLIFTKTDSTIMTQDSVKKLNKTCNTNSNNGVCNQTTHMKGAASDLSNTINYEYCQTEMSGIQIIDNNPGSFRNLSGIINEQCEQKTDRGRNVSLVYRKIVQFRKLARKIPFRRRDRDQQSITNQLKTQYDMYIKKAANKRKRNFKKGFLETSTSFIQNDNKNKNNRTFTQEDKKYSSGERRGSSGQKRAGISMPKQKNKINIPTLELSTLLPNSKKKFSYISTTTAKNGREKRRSNSKSTNKRRRGLNMSAPNAKKERSKTKEEKNPFKKISNLKKQRRLQEFITKASNNDILLHRRNVTNLASSRKKNNKIQTVILSENDYETKCSNDTTNNKKGNRTNRALSSEKYTNLIKNLQKKKYFGFIGKPPNINFSNNNSDHIKQNRAQLKKRNNRSHSNISNTPREEPPIYSGEYDKANVSEKTASKLKEELLWFFPKNKISVNIINNTSQFKFLCQKGQVRFVIELFRLKEEKRILINTYLTGGDQQEFNIIKKNIHSILNK